MGSYPNPPEPKHFSAICPVMLPSTVIGSEFGLQKETAETNSAFLSETPLISRSMRIFRDMGMTETAHGVDADNPSGALQLYTGLGYRVNKEFITFRREMETA